MENQISKLKNSPVLKIGFILIMILLLMIPNALIQELTNERSNRKSIIESEVARSYGQSQKVMVPLLRLPYTVRFEDKDGNKFSSRDGVYTLTPTKSEVNGHIATSTRKRSIYEVVVYDSKLKLESILDDSTLANSILPNYNFHYDKAHLIVGLSDPNGLSDNSSVSINGNTLQLDGISDYRNGALRYVKTESFNYEPGKELQVAANMNFKGTQALMIEPVGNQMKVKLTSPWMDPSFSGTRLPDNYDITDGFTSVWTTNQYAHDYPSSWADDHKVKNKNYGFGVDLIQPINEYSKNLRTTKYALLIISLTFGIFFFFEILLKKKIHPIQYILIGFALTVFYLLLLSITEHLGFDLAYLISSIATICLIVAYARHILQSIKSTAILGLLLSSLFGYIFIILQMQDFALLAGALALFSVLALVMMLSRKVDWYALSQGISKKSENQLV